jgi:hypothetical protein
MTVYTQHKSWIITHSILNMVKTKDTDIDDTITITDTDLLECTNRVSSIQGNRIKN